MLWVTVDNVTVNVLQWLQFYLFSHGKLNIILFCILYESDERNALIAAFHFMLFLLTDFILAKETHSVWLMIHQEKLSEIRQERFFSQTIFFHVTCWKLQSLLNIRHTVCQLAGVSTCVLPVLPLLTSGTQEYTYKWSNFHRKRP